VFLWGNLLGDGDGVEEEGGDLQNIGLYGERYHTLLLSLSMKEVSPSPVSLSIFSPTNMRL